MTYESWRISYQSSEAAARSAWQEMNCLLHRVNELEAQLSAIGAGGVEPLRKAGRAAMTHTSTDQERAEFEAWYIAGARKAVPAFAEWSEMEIREGCMRPDSGSYRIDSARIAWDAWQAARRAPVAQVPQSIEQMAVDRYKVVPSHSSMFYPCAVVAGDGQQQLYIGREAECQNMARKFTGAFLDGAFVALAAAPQPPEAAPVPPFTILAQHKLDDLLAQGFSVTGYSIERTDVADWAPQRGFVTSGGLVGWWTPHAADGLDSRAADRPVE